MSAAPYMQFYVGDYIQKTLHLSTEQHGAYLLLLMALWNGDASLPNDPAKLARITRVSPKRWPAVWAEIAMFFTVDDGRISQDRLTKERQKVLSLSQERKHFGSLGGKAKALKSKGEAVASATILPSVCYSKSEPEPYSKKERDKSLSLVCDGFEDFWNATPRKIAKASAQKAYAKALRQTDAATLLTAIKRYAETRQGQDPQYTAHPATWLNAGRWADAPENQTKGTPNGKGDQRLAAALRGAAVTSPMDRGAGGNPSQPLLALR